MKQIVFFSNNKNKILEVSNLFLKSKFKILSLNNFNKIISPEETGETFEENAKIKSIFGFKKFNKICFADDSGICIHALNNRPGVNSRQFLESKKNHKEILKSIINVTKNKNSFSAFFQTTICLCLNEDKKIFLIEINPRPGLSFKIIERINKKSIQRSNKFFIAHNQKYFSTTVVYAKKKIIFNEGKINAIKKLYNYKSFSEIPCSNDIIKVDEPICLVHLESEKKSILKKKSKKL